MKTSLFTLLLLSALLLNTNVLASKTFAPLPNSLKELVQTSDIIVVGKLETVVSNQKFYGYQETAPALEALDKVTPMPLGLYRTELQIKVNQWLKGKQQVANQPLIIGMVTPKIVTDINVLNQKMRRHHNKIHKQLFFLRKNPDATYSLNSAMGALHFKATAHKNAQGKTIEKPVLRLVDKEYMPFNLNLTAPEFYQRIKAYVQQQRQD